MGTTTRNLIEIKEVTDTDVSYYRVGEIDWRVSSLLDEYIEKYGREGANELVQALGFMIYTVRRKFMIK